MLIHLENENKYDELISKGKVLVDFYATWCGPCTMLTPELEKLASEDESLQIIKVDVDEFPNIARRYRVMSIPTLLLFKDGKLVNSKLGYMPLVHLKEFVA